MASSGSKGIRKKLMKGKGKYARYRNQNTQVKHCIRRILNSQGLKAAEDYCRKYDISAKQLIAPITSKCKVHTAQNRWTDPHQKTDEAGNITVYPVHSIASKGAQFYG